MAKNKSHKTAKGKMSQLAQPTKWWSLNQVITDEIAFFARASVAPNRHRQQTCFLLLYLLYLALSFRFLTYAYLVKFDQLSLIISFDYFLSIFIRGHIPLDYLLFLFTSTVPPFIIVIHALLYYSPDTRIWSYAYDLTVLNRSQLERATLGPSPFRFPIDVITMVKNPFGSALKYLHMSWNLYKGDLKFKRGIIPRLRLSPLLTIQQRTRLLLVLIFIETILKLYYLALVPAALVNFFFYYHHQNCLIGLFQLLDVFTCALSAVIYLRMGILLIYLSTAFCFASTWSYHCQNRQLSILIMKYFIIQSNHWWSHFAYTMNSYLVGHNRQVQFLLHLGHRLAAPALATFFITNVFLNIYSIVYLVFHRLPLLDRLIVQILWLLQVLVPLIIVLNLIVINQMIGCSKGNVRRVMELCRVQSVGGGGFNFKWKLATHYELLHRTVRPLAMTAGPLGELTKRSLVSFATFYGAYCVFFCGTFLEEKSRLVSLENESI